MHPTNVTKMTTSKEPRDRLLAQEDIDISEPYRHIPKQEDMLSHIEHYPELGVDSEQFTSQRAAQVENMPSKTHAASLPPTPPSNADEVPRSRPLHAVIEDRHVHLRPPNNVLPTQKRKVSNPDLTPPLSVNSPHMLHSRQSSTVAESFKTAQESPWQSRDDLQPDVQPASPRGTDYTLGSDRHADLQNFTESGEMPAGQFGKMRITSDPLPLSNGTPDRKVLPPRLDITTPRASSIRSRQPGSPRTPTSAATPKQGFGLYSPRQRVQKSSSIPPESPNRRFSTVSSSNSTIIEAIVISTPAPKPKKLRHVSKTPSLRSAVDSTSSPKSPRRTLSESGVFQSVSALDTATTPAVVPIHNGQNLRQPTRIVTDPTMTHKAHDSVSTVRAELEERKHEYAVQLPFQSDISQPLMYMPLSALPQFKTWSQSMADTSRVSSSQRSSSYASRRSEISLSSSHSQRYSARNTTFSSLPLSGHVASDSLASLNSGSLITVVRQPLLNSSEGFSAVRKSSVAQPANDMDLDSRDVSPPLLEVSPAGYEASIGSRQSPSNTELHPRTSLDGITMLSEDHPKHIYSQSTPFSQLSYTPQLNEAQAVSIHPHHNHSLLVVDQREQPNNALHKPAPAVKGNMDEGKSVAPQISVQPSTPPNMSSELTAVDSPLRNPRAAPPVPPKINVLPATPCHDEDDPLNAVHVVSVERPSVMTRARRYSDNLLQPFLSRSGSQRRRHSTIVRSNQPINKDHHLHPLWQPRDFWMHASDSESEWDDDDEGVDRLPPGGDTSEPPTYSKFVPRSLSRRLPAFRGTGGFLIGNSLNLERHGTNKRRHYVDPPEHFNGSHVSLRRDSAEHHPQTSSFHQDQQQPDSQLRNKQSISSLRSTHSQRRLRRRRRRTVRILGVSVEYVGVAGLRDQWQYKKQQKEHRQAEKRRDEIRKSIGPKFLVENGLDAVTTQHAAAAQVVAS